MGVMIELTEEQEQEVLKAYGYTLPEDPDTDVASIAIDDPDIPAYIETFETTFGLNPRPDRKAYGGTNTRLPLACDGQTNMITVPAMSFGAGDEFWWQFADPANNVVWLAQYGILLPDGTADITHEENIGLGTFKAPIVQGKQTVLLLTATDSEKHIAVDQYGIDMMFSVQIV